MRRKGRVSVNLYKLPIVHEVGSRLAYLQVEQRLQNVSIGLVFRRQWFGIPSQDQTWLVDLDDELWWRRKIQILEEGLGNRRKTMGDIMCSLSCLELFNDQRYDAIRLIFGYKSTLDLCRKTVNANEHAYIQKNTRQ